MKKTILELSFLSLLFACTNDFDSKDNLETKTKSEVQTINTADAQRDFSKLLSKAVYDSKEIRSFIKSESLKQFDNDFDVFYPYIKDKIVTGNKTFREILLQYCEDEKDLLSIERSLPLLNIAFPDLSFISKKSPKDYDVDDNEILVTYRKGNINNTFYAAGDSVFSLDNNEVPGFPFLVIKNNERMKATPTSRAAGGSYSYQFIDDAFDGSKKAETRTYIGDRDLPFDNPGNFVPASELNERVINAYNTFKDNPYAYQRDYIYYGLTSQKHTGGLLRNDMRESIYKFRVNPNFLSLYNDQDDFKINDDFSHKKSELSDEAILAREIWSDGNFEFRFDMIIGRRGCESGEVHECYSSVTPYQLFDLAKVHVHRRHATMFRHSKYTYWIDKKCLHPKWVDIKNAENLLNSKESILFEYPWDLLEYAADFKIIISEKDEKVTETIERTVNSSFVTKNDFSVDVSSSSDKGSVTLKNNLGFTSTESSTTKVTYVRQKGADEMGNIYFYYRDPVIVDKVTKNGTVGYNVYYKTNGMVDLMLMPVNINKK